MNFTTNCDFCLKVVKIPTEIVCLPYTLHFQALTTSKSSKKLNQKEYDGLLKGCRTH